MLWQIETFRCVTAGVLRPGGLKLTAEALQNLQTFGLKYQGLAIDLGCGLGASLKLLGSLGFKTLGLDLNLAAKDICSDFCLQADLNALPLKSEIASLFLLECVLSLLPKPEKTIRQSFNLLNPGGFGIIADLILQDGFFRADFSSCLDGARSQQEWEAMIGRAGFKILDFFDAKAALRELAAKLVWYGGDFCSDLCRLRGVSYGLWLLKREFGT